MAASKRRTRQTSRKTLRKPSSARPSLERRAPARVPRGGYWRVSLCIGGNRWRRLNWIGSHFEADHLADNYRRKCHRVAVHRDGQPPRERSAPVLPLSYRPPKRDPERDTEAIPKLLAEFVRANDKASAIVLTDALLEGGYDWAAFDLKDSLARGCRERRGLANRILSEVLNDSVVLEHGTWSFGRTHGSLAINPYVLVLERTPVHFRGGTRRGTTRKHEPRIVIWSRSGDGTRCRWRLYGSYGRTEFGTVQNAEETARKDIAFEQRERSRSDRVRERVRRRGPSDYEECGDCGFDHAYEPNEATTWHRANPGSYE